MMLKKTKTKAQKNALKKGSCLSEQKMPFWQWTGEARFLPSSTMTCITDTVLHKGQEHHKYYARGQFQGISQADKKKKMATKDKGNSKPNETF